MSLANAADFELIIGNVPVAGAATATRHPVQAVTPAGSAFEVIDLDPDDPALKNHLSAATGEGPGLDLRKQLGTVLFKSLFRGEILLRWERSLGQLGAGKAFETLRMRLWFRDPALAVLPWELLYSESDKRFLATDAGLTLSRYLAGPEPSYQDPVAQLRVLAVACRPKDLPPIPDQDVDRLREFLGRLGPTVVSKLLEDPDLNLLQGELAKNPHVLHYLGHGEADHLFFTEGDGRKQKVPIENLRQLALGRRELRVVVLNACESGQSSTADVFSGVGPGFVEAGVPAVIAMQYESVYLADATRFNATFYDRLAKGESVDKAVTEARQAISAADLSARAWSTPILYLGTRGGRVIELATDPTAASRPWAKIRQAASETGFARGALDQLAEELRKLSARLEKLEAAAAVNDALQALYGQVSPLLPFEGAQEQMLPAGAWPVVRGVWPAVEGEPLAHLRRASEGGGGELAALWQPLAKPAADLDAAVRDGAMGRIPAAIAALHAALDDYDGGLRALVRTWIRAASASARETLAPFRRPASAADGTGGR
jgi:hypothetical protein